MDKKPAASPFRRHHSGDQSLTDRELEVLILLAGGQRNSGIASSLHISIRTVEQHIANMQEKLSATTRTELVALAYAMGILRPGTWPPAWSGVRFARIRN